MDSAKRAREEVASAATAEPVAKQPRAERGASVMLARMSMFGKVASVDDFVNVFPNYRHANRKDGVGCATLSPMNLGPVDLNQPGVVGALNLENFWQQSKKFPDETFEQFRAAQQAGFLDPLPHRHKKGKRGKKPEGWMWTAADGTIHVLGWVESRQFYCNLYERMVRDLPEFKNLEALLQAGYNLRICGYDGKPYEEDETAEEAYLSTAAPFGHERVLEQMLSEPDESKWPWRKHKTFDF